MMQTDAPATPAERKRGGCLTAVLLIFGGLTLIASLTNLVLGNKIASLLPNAPAWAPAGVLGAGLLGLVALAALVKIWRWQRTGLYLLAAVNIAIFALNTALLGLAQSWSGLVGLLVISLLVLQQWEDFS